MLRATRGATPYDGKSAVDVYNLEVGNYAVDVTYNGDDNYNKRTVTADFDVVKDNTNISVEHEDSMNIRESQVINITINNTNASGKAIISIDSENHTADVENGVANFTVKDLSSGNHTITVFYEGDDNLTGSWTQFNIEVNKLDADVNVSISNSTVGGKQTVTVEVPSDATGQVLIDINDNHYYANVTDGKAILVLDSLPADDYTVNVTYLGDENYTGKSDTASFKVTKNNSTVGITPQTISVGENEVITFTLPDDATGNLTVVVNDKTYNVPVDGGNATLTIPGLFAGNYTIDVTYNGDGKYASSTNSTKFEVEKAKVSSDDIKVVDQGNGTVVVVVPSDLTGEISIKVGDDTYNGTIEDGKAVITLDKVAPGTYDVDVIYSGDGNHTNASTTASVTTNKEQAPISASADPIKVGDAATVVVELPDGATGNVTIEIDGVKYTTDNITGGKATFTIENLTNGTKTIAVEYSGDDTYRANHTTATIEVSKVTPEVKMDIKVDDDTAIIEVTAPDDATGTVLIDVDGTGYYVNLTEGKGKLILMDMAGGNHDVSAVYLGNDKYGPSDANVSSFEVSDVPSTVSVEVDNITYGDKAVIEVTVPSDATGTVTVTIGGKPYEANVTNGKATIIVPDLKADNYTVEASYSGDGKYASSSGSTKLEVSKAIVEPEDIKVINQHNGTVVVVVPDGATGTVTVTMDGVPYNATVENGMATITLPDTIAGTHAINVTYSGDENHTGAATKSEVTLPELATPISVSVDPINVGDTAVVTVTVPDNATGIVTIEIDGVKYNATVDKGKAVFNIENLTAGNKTIAVAYAGDDNYFANYTTAAISVSKSKVSDMEVEISDIDAGDNLTVKVKLPDDATGQVLIDIDGVGYYLNVTDGVGEAQIPYLPSGNYTVTLTYTGDDKYGPTTKTESFEVSKVESFVIPVAEDIAVGEAEVISIRVPSDATGSVTVVIGGEMYEFDLDTEVLSVPEGDDIYTVAIDKGTGKLTIVGLTRGNYAVSVKYNGDDKYAPSTNSTTFKVSKTHSDMEITDLGNRTVVVQLPDDATGNVTIRVGDEEYTAKVINGTATVDLTNTTPGEHPITVEYTGDETYSGQTKDSTVTIPKYETPISADVGNIEVGDTEVITVNVPDGASGNVTIEIDGEPYTSEINDGKAVFKVNGLTAGDKTVVVKYDGDNNFTGNFTTAQFSVSKKQPKIKPSAKNIKAGKDEIITVEVPSDATGRVLVKVNGVGYYGDVINGKAKVVIPGLSGGDYTAEVLYEGDDKYLPSAATYVKFTVAKSTVPISAKGDMEVSGDDASVVVKLPKDATGTVTITVDGKTYSAEVINGEARFDIPGLDVGSHVVYVHYSGDAKYDANDTVTAIIIESNGSSGDGDSSEGISLSKYATANPIWVLLLIILAIGSTQIRRFRK